MQAQGCIQTDPWWPPWDPKIHLHSSSSGSPDKGHGRESFPHSMSLKTDAQRKPVTGPWMRQPFGGGAITGP